MEPLVFGQTSEKPINLPKNASRVSILKMLNQHPSLVLRSCIPSTENQGQLWERRAAQLLGRQHLKHSGPLRRHWAAAAFAVYKLQRGRKVWRAEVCSYDESQIVDSRYARSVSLDRFDKVTQDDQAANTFLQFRPKLLIMARHESTAASLLFASAFTEHWHDLPSPRQTIGPEEARC